MLKLSWELETLLNFLEIPFTKHSQFVDDGCGVEDEMIHLEVDKQYAVQILNNLIQFVDIKKAESMWSLTSDLF